MLLAADHFFTKVNAKKIENENTSWEDPSVASLSSDEGPRLISVKQVLHIAEPFKLENGESLPELDVVYETFGTLNDKKDNAILVIHALTGDSHCCGYYTYYPKEKAGWWSNLIGPGKAIDTNKYFVICTNNLGGCSNDVYPPVEGAPPHTTNPASIDPRTGKRYNMTFPEYTFGDAVNVQKLVVDHFGIKRLLAVVGGSMGGMMTLEWARRYPDNLSCIIAVATNAHLSPQGIAFSEVERQSIRLDPKWKGGDYPDNDPPAKGLGVARMIAHITYLSQQSMRAKFGRRKQQRDGKVTDQFEVESYLEHQGTTFVKRFDANSYLYITEALDDYDLIREGETLDDAVANFKCLTLMLSFRTDWLFPTKETAEVAEALRRQGKIVEFNEVDSDKGHDGFLIDYQKYENLVSCFLERVYRNYNKSF